MVAVVVWGVVAAVVFYVVAFSTVPGPRTEPQRRLRTPPAESYAPPAHPIDFGPGYTSLMEPGRDSAAGPVDNCAGCGAAAVRARGFHCTYCGRER